MFVLVACEESQVVCKAFRDKGHIAFSCDIQNPSGGRPEWHIKCDVLDILRPKNYPVVLDNGCIDNVNGIRFNTMSADTYFIPKWDLVIAHPPCTMLCATSSVALSKGFHTKEDIEKAVSFFMEFYNLENTRVCIENPRPLFLCGLPRYTQSIQPYEFGDNYTKLTLLWLKNLPPLIPNCYASPGQKRSAAPSWCSLKHNSKDRSKTFEGIALAMAQQWNF